MKILESKALLITDGDCEFCQLSANWLARKFPGDWVNLHNQKADLKSLGLSEAEVSKQVWYLVPSGNSWKKYAGANAIFKLLLQQPKFFIKPFAYLFTLPGLKSLAQGIYIWVTRNRHRLMWIFKR
jgi:predicted DCC family thiol-disulfide oxidoreductase YuxK